MNQSLLEKAFGVSGKYRCVRVDYQWGLRCSSTSSFKAEALVCPQCGSAQAVIRKAAAVPGSADRADRPQTGLSGDRGGSLPVPALRGDLRAGPPFARAAVHYTRKLEEFVARWSRVMTIEDVADLAGLSWDAAKRIVKRRLRRDYGQIDLHGVKHLSIDEIYVGKRRGYYTLVLGIWTAGGFSG